MVVIEFLGLLVINGGHEFISHWYVGKVMGLNISLVHELHKITRKK